MKTVSYKDPYEPIPVVIQIEDDDEEGFEKALEFLNENTRHIQNAERKERYHTALHLEGLIYDGPEYAAKKDEYEEAELEEEESIIDMWLRENLTEVQYRRFRLLMDGLSIRDVARYEAADYSSVNESILYQHVKYHIQKSSILIICCTGWVVALLVIILCCLKHLIN